METGASEMYQLPSNSWYAGQISGMTNSSANSLVPTSASFGNSFGSQFYTQFPTTHAFGNNTFTPPTPPSPNAMSASNQSFGQFAFSTNPIYERFSHNNQSSISVSGSTSSLSSSHQTFAISSHSYQSAHVSHDDDDLCSVQDAPYDWMRRTTYGSTPQPGKTRTRDKYRVVYSDTQRLELEKEFHYSRYITIRRKSELASMLGLSERQVKIWFQNRRAKDRKQFKKHRDDSCFKSPQMSNSNSISIMNPMTPSRPVHNEFWT